MVAVRPQEAERFAAAPPPGLRLFLVYGSDPGGVTERARALERVALQRGGGDAPIRIGSDELGGRPGGVAEELNSASLFGGEPVVALRVLDGRHNVMGAVQPVFAEPPAAGWLIVEAGELPPANALRKAFETAPHAAALPTYPLEGASLNAFIRAAAEEAGVRLAPDALDALAEHLSGDRQAARRELEKLFLYLGPGGTAGLAEVEAVVGEVGGVKLDELIDAALLGNCETVEAGLARLEAEGGSVSGLATQTLRHLCQLSAFRAAMDGGLGAAAVLDRARPPVFARRRSTVEAELRRWPSADLAAARHRVDRAVALARTQPALERAAISEALHAVALRSRRLGGQRSKTSSDD